jgi:hypothetical protein
MTAELDDPVGTAAVLNGIVAGPPPAGHRISFIRLGATETIDLRDLYARAGRVARHLVDLGVRPGDRIGVLAAKPGMGAARPGGAADQGGHRRI